jgi:HTH-like domain
VSAFIDENRKRFGVEPICETLGVSASAYYRRATGARSARSVEDDRLLERIREVHERNYQAYGSWRMWRALRRAGEEVGRGRAERLMRRNRIRGAKRCGKPWRTTSPDPEAFAAARSRPARLHGDRSRRALVRGLHLPSLLGRRRLLSLQPIRDLRGRGARGVVRAELGLRGAVIYRKLSLGSQSDRGERSVERLLSASVTCRLRQRSLFAYLTEVITAHARGDPKPALSGHPQRAERLRRPSL